ncbi:adenylate kinase [Achlya hypogyna]|uniref:Adenylate kinase n=1 Tax=Achlya hypogyna TaxID=1202772 RepID=A0A1V9Y9V6_ACHHY|nr:adenylate kinase [Achlya hypogyna]
MIQAYVSGPPGSGKTTLSKRLAATLQLEHLATGDILREHIKARTDLGVVAKKCIAAKTLVPDDVIVEMVAERAARAPHGYVLDGFPRTPEQTRLLKKKAVMPNVMLVLDLPKEEIRLRITGRRMDPKTGDIYHADFHLPSDPEVLARLIHRDDDTAEKVPARIEAYAHYGALTNREFINIAYDLDADRSIRDVVAEATDILRSVSKVQARKEAGNQLSALALPIAKALLEQPHEIECSPPKARNSVRSDDGRASRAHKVDAEIQRVGLELQAPPSVDNNARVVAPMLLGRFRPEDTAKLVEMERFKTMLISGFDIIKHGRRGAPHTRTLFSDVEFKRLFWQKPDKKELKPKLDQSIALSDVVEVRRGIKTEVFNRSGDAAKAGRYLSLMADDRTLDIEAATDDICGLLVLGFTHLTQ